MTSKIVTCSLLSVFLLTVSPAQGMRATEAGSHRTSGHRIENAPLTEYQMSPFAPASRYTLARGQSLGSSLWFLSLSSTISLAAMISQVR